MSADEHARGVEIAKGWLEREGYELEDAPEVDDHVANAYGEKRIRKDDHEVVHKRMVEVETALSVSSDEAKRRMKALARWASAYDSREAVVFVPEGSLVDARAELYDYDIWVEFARGE